jgi:phosphinothricin acetyltransferase
MDFTIVDATPVDVPAIAAILNDAIRNTTAIWHESSRGEADIAAWLASRQKDYVVLAARDESRAIGYASYGPYRPYSGYDLTVEHSVYVRQDLRGRGIGKALLGALIDKARTQGFHVMVGGIDATNRESIALHTSFGFVETARMPEVGRKFGKWLDLVFMQKKLS